MPYVTCPTCGERGKIPSTLIGVRIKCRKCGLSFLVSPPAGKAAVGAGVGAEAAAGHGAAAHAAAVGPSAAVEAHGIEVEGLDASSWALPTEAAQALAGAHAHAHVEPHPAGAGAAAPVATAPDPAPPAGAAAAAREYKLLTSRDKYFDGKFEMARMEEALNHFARLGWVAKGVATPHLKGYSGALEEVFVVLLERSHEAS